MIRCGKILTKSLMVAVLLAAASGIHAQVVNDSVILEDARPVVFEVNKTLISEEDIKWITDTLKNELQKSELMMVYARAAASPEGPYLNNVRLSKERYAAMEKYLSRFGIPKDRVVKDIIAEDYQLVRAMLRRDNDAEYPVLDSIMTKYGKNEASLKAALQKYNGGKLWKRLLKDYYPKLRAVRLILLYNVPDFEIPELTTEPVAVDWTAPEYTFAQPDERVFNPYYPKEPRREVLSLKTNLLFDFAYMPGYDRWCPIPNVALEYYPLHGHFTYGASIDFPWWQHYRQQKYFQLRNYQLETRYYFRSGDINDVGIGNGAAYKGWYVKAYAHAGLFSICFDANRGWEGEGLGAGLGLGYVMPLSRNERWRLEFGAQLGFFWCKHDPYQYECPVDPTEQDHLYYYKWTLDADLFKKRQHRWSWTGPTRVEVTLSYDLFYRPNHKKGISTRSWEPSPSVTGYQQNVQKGGDR